jgi:hypothetical protein
MKINIKDLTDYINSKKYDYKIFNIIYSKIEKECIDNFNINHSNSYRYLGTYENMNNITNFLQNVGSNSITNINKFEKIIRKMIINILKVYKFDNFILDIRVSLPNNNFDIVRWHKDYGYGNETSKFAVVLQGPGTLFIKSTKEVNNIYHKIHDKEVAIRRKKKLNFQEQNELREKYRIKYANSFKKYKITQPNNNQGVIFFSGDRQKNINGALHSEPKIDNNRIFISILPQTKEFIDNQIEFANLLQT